ncbi:hypothetical protein ACODNH_00075 (plasmid) [Haloarcula sp. NS06]|uniref:hypothetical protein n=1 Tax=Haloarcula sp. NS06 TaxID=3409688 RepID=UPI003DA73510
MHTELVVQRVVVHPLWDGSLAGREGDSLLVFAFLTGIVLLPLALATACSGVDKVL